MFLTFCEFNRKAPVSESFLITAGPQNCNFIKKRLLWNLQNFKEHLILLNNCSRSLWQFPATLLKKRFQQICFCVTNFSRTSFDRSAPDDYFLSLSVKFWETAYFMYKLQNFKKQIQWKAFKAFYKRTRSSHTKRFIYLK